MTIIKIDGEIGWSVTAQNIKEKLDEASGDLQVEISSPGGSVFQGVEIFNAIKAYDKGEVTTVITSLAASMASYIALAGDKIKAYSNAVYMIHNASVYSWGDARALRKSANIVESLSNLLAKEYIKKTGKTEKEISKMMDDETYLFGSEIKDNNFVDEIIDAENEEDQNTALALAGESVKACVSSWKEHFKEDEYKEIAALLTTTTGVNPASAKIETKTKGENSMEYTEESFKALEDNHAEALKANSKDVEASERKRVSDIFALGGNDEFTQKAIIEGLTVGDAAIALLKERKDANAKQATDFEAAGAEANEAGNVEAGEEELNEEQKATRDAEAALENLNLGAK